MRLAPKRAPLGVSQVLLARTAVEAAQEPATPPPATSERTRPGPNPRELLPDLGRIGSQVGIPGGRLLEPLWGGPGFALGGFLTGPLLRRPGGKLSGERLLSFPQATGDPFRIPASKGRGGRPRGARRAAGHRARGHRPLGPRLEAHMFPAGLRSHAVELRGDHLGHRNPQVAIAEERGRRPPEARSDYEFGPLRGWDHLLRQAAEIEWAAQPVPAAPVSQIRNRDDLLSAAFILVDEVRHLTVWRRGHGLKIY